MKRSGFARTAWVVAVVTALLAPSIAWAGGTGNQEQKGELTGIKALLERLDAEAVRVQLDLMELRNDAHKMKKILEETGNPLAIVEDLRNAYKKCAFVEDKVERGQSVLFDIRTRLEALGFGVGQTPTGVSTIGPLMLKVKKLEVQFKAFGNKLDWVTGLLDDLADALP